jgi:hypothetical protein
MKNPIIITILLMLSTVLVKAQDVKKTQSQPDSLIKIIPAGYGDNSIYLYTIGGKLATREDIAVRLMAYAPSAEEYHAAKNNIAWSYVSFGATAISGTIATLDYAHNDRLAGATVGFVNGEPATIYQHHSLTGAYVFTGLATAFLISSFVNLARAGFHANRAIRVYNQRYE